MRRITPLCAALAALALASPALAWKPRTHVFLAEQAMADALDDGKVTIYRIDPGTNRMKLGEDGKPVELGRFAVRPEALEALRKHPAQFRAGVLGPDAFPDIITGQTIIHPAGKVTPGETDVDLNLNGTGSDPWLQHLFTRAFNSGGIKDSTPANRAFVLGFLSHAAGDMYGHTFINSYTGDAFHFQPEPTNAIRHIVIEGYVDRHVPSPTFDSSIGDGVDGFIRRNMMEAKPGSKLETLLSGESSKLSMSAYFSQLRTKLQESLPKSSAPVAAYKRAWIKDIDSGMAAMPEFSHKMAVLLFYNAEGKAQTGKARKLADDFKKAHLLSMLGLPDAVGASMRIFDSIVEALGIEALKEMIDAIKKDAFEYIIVKATGISPAALKKYLEEPETQFDPVMDKEPQPGGKRTTRAEFDVNELSLAPGQREIDYRNVPAAYNTVTMIKLLLLGKDEVNRLVALLAAEGNGAACTDDPPAASQLAEDNIMLGFIETLDGSRQWKANERKMVLARSERIYGAVFMAQPGDAVPAGR